MYIAVKTVAGKLISRSQVRILPGSQLLFSQVAELVRRYLVKQFNARCDLI